ncbi:hypothetical protein Syun_001615 [Stephania yunnanensis]|uniref:Uncharacterized protein n=1 Tax=Stephania yunnanensis TaxID=152371 RepID=A0AAP0LF32_9MAGN
MLLLCPLFQLTPTLTKFHECSHHSFGSHLSNLHEIFKFTTKKGLDNGFIDWFVFLI